MPSRLNYPGDGHFVAAANVENGTRVDPGHVQALPPFSYMMGLLHQVNALKTEHDHTIPASIRAAEDHLAKVVVAAEAGKRILAFFKAGLGLLTPETEPTHDGGPDGDDAGPATGEPGEGPGGDPIGDPKRGQSKRGRRGGPRP